MGGEDGRGEGGKEGKGKKAKSFTGCDSGCGSKNANKNWDAPLKLKSSRESFNEKSRKS